LGVEKQEGWANSHSNDNEEISIIPFRSDRAYAKACAHDDWKNYSATEIPLAEFLESWCVGMAENKTLVGANWDVNMFGKESDALVVAFDILTLLKENNSTIRFRDYSSIDEFITDISEE
jgi:hypothetical protein